MGPAGEELATSCPNIATCGTLEPMYIKGSMPSIGDVKDLPSYVNSLHGGCGDRVGVVKVKNCGAYYVYHLTPTRKCPRAYCVGSEVVCPAGTTSDTGFTPDCARVIPGITQTAIVTPALKSSLGGNGKKTEQLTFQCSTTTAGTFPKNAEIEVLWEVSDRGVVHTERQSVMQGNTIFTLETKHWMDMAGQNLGRDISCKVRVRTTGVPTPSFSTWEKSVPFFAGIKILNNTIVLPWGGKATIQLELTVPIPCPPDLRQINGCDIQVFLQNPKFQTSHIYPPSKTCNSTSVTALEGTSCVIEFKSSPSFVNFTIHAKSILGLTPTIQSTFVRLATEEIVWNDLFSNYTLPDIKVKIVPPSIKRPLSGICTMRRDPHVETFDGYKYDHMIEGEFVILKDSANDIQVNGFFQRVSSKWVGLCAIAVYSAGEVLVYDKCLTKNQVQLPGALNLTNVHVGTKGCKFGFSYSEGSNTFEIGLPNGMKIQGESPSGYSSETHFNLKVTATDSSFGSLVGLCGTFDGTNKTDLLHSDFKTTTPLDSHPYSNHIAFSKSWRASQDDSLFNNTKGLPTTHNTPTFCSCDEKSTNDPNVTCGADVNLRQCYGKANYIDLTKALYRRCSSSAGRGKREAGGVGQAASTADYDDDYVVEPHINASWSYSKPQWINDWSQAKAVDLCNVTLNNPTAVIACSVPGINRNTYFDQCVQDIKITGTPEFVNATVADAIEDARDLILRDPSLWSVSPSGVLQPDFTVLDKLCPNDCSNNGFCKEGECVCQGDYFGEDCGRSMHDTPVLSGVAWGGVCDSSIRPCYSSIRRQICSRQHLHILQH